MYEDLLGKHITVILPPNTAELSPESIAQIFSGHLVEVSSTEIKIRCADNCFTIWNRRSIIGVVENEILAEDDPRTKAFQKQTPEENPS